MRARRRLDGPPTATLHVPYAVTREQMAALLVRSTRWRPGCSARIGQAAAADTLRADPDALTRPAPADARYRTALRDVDRWLIFPPTGDHP